MHKQVTTIKIVIKISLNLLKQNPLKITILKKNYVQNNLKFLMMKMLRVIFVKVKSTRL